MTSKDGFTQFSATAQPWLGSVNTQPAKKQTELPTRNKHPTTGPLLKYSIRPKTSVVQLLAQRPWLALGLLGAVSGGVAHGGAVRGAWVPRLGAPVRLSLIIFPNLSRGFILPVWCTHLFVVFFVSCIFPTLILSTFFFTSSAPPPSPPPASQRFIFTSFFQQK